MKHRRILRALTSRKRLDQSVFHPFLVLATVLTKFIEKIQRWPQLPPWVLAILGAGAGRVEQGCTNRPSGGPPSALRLHSDCHAEAIVAEAVAESERNSWPGTLFMHEAIYPLTSLAKRNWATWNEYQLYNPFARTSLRRIIAFMLALG